ncbi:MAG: hypothetical protein IJR66_01750 [Clostridia bacterium]|nr:hypothetical protein [Clostridia bacterium]
MERKNCKNILIFILTVISLFCFTLFFGAFGSGGKKVVNAEEEPPYVEEPVYVTESCTLSGQYSTPYVIRPATEVIVITLDGFNYYNSGEEPVFTINTEHEGDYARVIFMFNGENNITTQGGNIFYVTSQNIDLSFSSSAGGSANMQCYNGSPILYSSGYFYIEETFLSSAIIDNETYGKDQVGMIISAIVNQGVDSVSLYFVLPEITTLYLSNEDNNKTYVSGNNYYGEEVPENYVVVDNYTALVIEASGTFNITLRDYFFQGTNLNECAPAITIYNDGDSPLTVNIVVENAVNLIELDMPAIRLMNDGIICAFTCADNGNENHFIVQRFVDRNYQTGVPNYSGDSAIYSLSPSSTFVYDENCVIGAMPPNGDIQPTYDIEEAMTENGFYAFTITYGENSQVDPTHEHNYTGISYEWNEDYSACIAIAYCENCEERITEEATISYSEPETDVEALGDSANAYIGNRTITTVYATFENSYFTQQIQYIHNVVLERNNNNQPYFRYNGGVVIVTVQDGYSYDAAYTWNGGIAITNWSNNDPLYIYFVFEGDATIISGQNHPAIRVGDDGGIYNITCYITTSSQSLSTVKFATSGNECPSIMVSDGDTSRIIIDGNAYVQGIYGLYDFEEEKGTLIETENSGQALSTIMSGDYQACIINMSASEIVHEHNYVITETYPATCTENGGILYECECGESYMEIIPATGHVPDYDCATTEHGVHCTVCGEEIEGKLPTEQEEKLEPVKDLINVDISADATEEEKQKAEEQQQKIEEALEIINPETVEEIVDKVSGALNVLEEELERQLEGKTEEEQAEIRKEYEENVEKVTIILQSSLIVGAKMDSAVEEAEEFVKTIPENTGINMSDLLGDFYKRQYELLLNKNQGNSSATGYAKRYDASGATGLDLDTDKDTYKNAVEFVDTSVSNMKNAVLLIRTCSGSAVKESVNDYVNRVAYSSFKDFDKDVADREFVENAYTAIMLNLQEQVLSTLEKEYQETKASGKYSGKALEDYEATYNEQVENVSDFETFEIMILEVMRQKYVTVLNERLDNKLLTKDEYDVLFEGAKDVDAFEEKYNEIFTNWALNKEDASGITLEEISNSVIGNTKKKMGAGEYLKNGLSTLELVIFIVVFGALAIGGITILVMKALPVIKAKRRGER